MRRYTYFILILVLFSCNAAGKKETAGEQVNTSTSATVSLGYDAIRRTILPPLLVLLTDKE